MGWCYLDGWAIDHVFWWLMWAQLLSIDQQCWVNPICTVHWLTDWLHLKAQRMEQQKCFPHYVSSKIQSRAPSGNSRASVRPHRSACFYLSVYFNVHCVLNLNLLLAASPVENVCDIYIKLWLDFVFYERVQLWEFNWACENVHVRQRKVYSEEFTALKHLQTP